MVCLTTFLTCSIFYFDLDRSFYLQGKAYKLKTQQQMLKNTNVQDVKMRKRLGSTVSSQNEVSELMFKDYLGYEMLKQDQQRE